MSNREIFIAGMERDVLECQLDTLTEESPLSDYNWDSLAIISTIALIDDIYHRSVDANAIQAAKTIGDLLKLLEV